MTLLLSRADVAGLIESSSAARAVEAALVAANRSTGRLHVQHGAAALHVVAGAVGDAEPLSVKVNVRVPDLTGRHQVSGVVVLFDSTGHILAVMDSTEITKIRTAILTSIAVRRLGFADASRVLLVGSGGLAQHHVRRLSEFTTIRWLGIWSRQPTHASALAAIANDAGVPAETVTDLAEAARTSDVIVTMTPSSIPLIGPDDVGPTSLLIALGADSPDKHEVHPRLLASSLVVVDDLAQCARNGELRHAIDAGLMSEGDVFASLSEVISGSIPAPGRDRRIVFDSTGTAMQDQAVAVLAFRLATAHGIGQSIDFLS